MSHTVCSRCVMDTTTQHINFDPDGICNFCSDFLLRCQSTLDSSISEKSERLNNLVSVIKESSGRSDYDCIVGVSGGVDSSWVLVKSVELGLKPLAVHMDNGWNSELATNNINNLIAELNVDLYTYVIDWSEYKSLMQAFFNAHVIDVEILYDHAMLAVNYNIARQNNIKHILFGSNLSTEGIHIPDDWNWLKNDARQIKYFAKSNNTKISSFPLIGSLKLAFLRSLHKIKPYSILDLLDYNKEMVLCELENKYGYKRYPYKHYESIFTRFYQGYLLPRKFNVDKRKVHFSTLIMTEQMARQDALRLLDDSPYPSFSDLDHDIDFFLRKMDWSHNDLTAYLNTPAQPHSNYPSEYSLFKFLYQFKNCISSS